MPITIRQATAADAPALAQLIESVWPETTASNTHITHSLAAPDHVAFVADDAGNLVGFVDSFVTVTPEGLRRCEVDLLAVHPERRGQRLGERLVQASTAAGRQKEAKFARGLIQVDNIASQRTFTRCGYTLDPTVRLLCISSEHTASPVALPPRAYFIPVQTCTYRGLWLEGDVSPEALRAAQTARLSGDWEIVGALVQANGDASPAPGYTAVDRYQWWMREL